MNSSELNFFASANSGRGFVNFYGDIFYGLKKHYIIKGGPGTGKSSLMKAVAKHAENKGLHVLRFYCSSDPDSLDGIIINELSIGISDGTAPHCADPRYPGVYGEIINLGQFWSTGILSEAKDSIIINTDKKTKLYKNVYAYLGAALKLDEIKEQILSESTDKENLMNLACSFADTLPYRKGRFRRCFTDAITMKGHKTFSPFNNEAEVIYNIKDSYGISHLFLGYIKDLLNTCETSVSYDAFDTNKINMLYQPTDKILFGVNMDNGEEIDIDEFVSGDIHKAAIIEKQKSALISEAYKLLSEIGSIHFDLEKIYISAMDFSKKEEYQNNLIKEIFS